MMKIDMGNVGCFFTIVGWTVVYHISQISDLEHPKSIIFPNSLTSAFFATYPNKISPAPRIYNITVRISNLTSLPPLARLHIIAFGLRRPFQVTEYANVNEYK